jgi:UDP-N-acetylmuramate--alanine ligase
VVAVFQPHLYSRTAREANAFGAALARADVVVVLEVYAAREQAADHPGVTAAWMAQAAAITRTGRTVAWLPGFDDAEAFLRSILRGGRPVPDHGGGDVDALGRRLVAR